MGQGKLTRRKICVVTTSRADYGLLYWLMKEVQADPSLKLQVVATGMHMSPEFGWTYRKIEQDGFTLDCKCEMLLSSDSDVSTVKSIGVGLISLADELAALKPDVIVVLGDRFELLSIVVAALILRIPVAHIHGGETSQGAFDEAVRHSITKMASIHFPATEAYRQRIIQMGEDPELTFNFGSPGLDSLYRETTLTKSELEQHLGFNLRGPIALVTYHPVTLENGNVRKEIDDVIRAIEVSGLKAIFTQANADPSGRVINERIRAKCAMSPEQFKFCDNLGRRGYFSALKHFDLMIGNSSSGITEAPSFGLPVVNIGDRQAGRVRAKNVIDVKCTQREIEKGIRLAVGKAFKSVARKARNPYDRFGDGRSAYRIKETLKTIPIGPGILKKRFRDISVI